MRERLRSDQREELLWAPLEERAQQRVKVAKVPRQDLGTTALLERAQPVTEVSLDDVIWGGEWPRLNVDLGPSRDPLCAASVAGLDKD